MSEHDADDTIPSEEPEGSEEQAATAAAEAEGATNDVVEEASDNAPDEAAAASETVIIETSGPDSEVATKEALAAGSTTVEQVEIDEEGDRRATAAFAGWAYLAFLFALFLVLALIAYGCDDDSVALDTSSGTTSTVSAAGDALTPVALVFAVDGDQVTLQGAVPDDGARQQLVDLAEARYGDGNVVDELTVDDGMTLENGTLSITGDTVVGDEGPAGLQADASAALGLAAGDFDVEFETVELTPIDGEVAVAADNVVLSGVLPNQDTVDSLVGAAEDTWGAGNVDASGLSVDAGYTTVGGQIRMTGSTDVGDPRVGSFLARAEADLGVVVDNSVDIDSSADALARLEDRLKARLAANPILFATGSADIDPESDAILQEAADAINAAPGIAVEVVGHTDDQGAEARNQELSEQRANAVLDRLVELGVDADRLTARGAGEAEPVADNETDEGRAANRRIAFEFEGAGDEGDTSEDEESTEEEDG